MRLIIVRHGETEANRDGINQGWSPGRLSPLGKKQSELLARALMKERIDLVYASDLDRVQETLAAYERLKPEVPVISTRELREHNLGGLEESPYGTIQTEAERSGKPFGEYRPPGGETMREMHGRVIAFFEEVRERHANETICLFTHDGPAIGLTLRLLGEPLASYREYHLGNACYHLLEERDGTWLLREKNNKRHLGAER